MTEKTTRDWSAFEKVIGVTFKNQDLLTQAFIHRSYLNENPSKGLEHNERLEFLGDAVLELAITNFLYREYPASPEGELTSYRAALVNANTMADFANEVGMNEYLYLSRGEAKDTGKARLYILANAIEALIGALYLDQGYDAAEAFIGRFLYGKAADIVKKKLWRDAKSLVQEKAQEHVGITPAYKVVKESGPDHDKHFTIGIFFGSDKIAEGKGHSKQEAEQAAARAALEAKKWFD
ncbi:MAG: ribonuclease III [Candidatus Pacebacteria bacterium]|nr:ribonuclease III [Candidatus Paceibacterota bacterium]